MCVCVFVVSECLVFRKAPSLEQCFFCLCFDWPDEVLGDLCSVTVPCCAPYHPHWASGRWFICFPHEVCVYVRVRVRVRVRLRAYVCERADLVRGQLRVVANPQTALLRGLVQLIFRMCEIFSFGCCERAC